LDYNKRLCLIFVFALICACSTLANKTTMAQIMDQTTPLLPNALQEDVGLSYVETDPSKHAEAIPAKPTKHLETEPNEPTKHLEAEPNEPTKHLEAEPNEPTKHLEAEPAEPAKTSQAKATKVLKPEPPKLLEAKTLFNLAWEAMKEHVKECETSSEVNNALGTLMCWQSLFGSVLGGKVTEDNVEYLQQTERKTREWAPLFKKVGFDVVCKDYDCSRRDGFKSNVYVTRISLDVLGLGGPDEKKTTIDFETFMDDDDCETNFKLTVSCGDDYFDVDYEHPRYFTTRASKAQEFVPPCVWQAMETILPIVVALDSSRDKLVPYVKAWYAGNVKDDIYKGGVDVCA
jgi:hypothetical protein